MAERADPFASRVRLRREGFGLSLSRLAELAGMNAAAIEGLEAGGTPSASEVSRIADALATEPGWLLGFTDDYRARLRTTARFRAPNGVPDLDADDARLLARRASSAPS